MSTYLFVRSWSTCCRLALFILLSSTPFVEVLAAAPPPQTPLAPMAVGELHSLVLSSKGVIWAWGDNSFGQVGDGTTQDRATAVLVKGFDNTVIQSVAAGGYHSLALDNSGNVYSWGSNMSGELGNGNYVANPTPTQIKSLSGFRQVVAGYNFSLALDNNGNVWAWGDNTYGQLGIGSTAGQATPIRIQSLSNIQVLAASGYHAMALDRNYNLYTWGDNTFGEVGNNTQQAMATLPVKISIVDAKNNPVSCSADIAAGFMQSYCITLNNTLLAWGRNDESQLGLPSGGTAVSTPTQVMFTTSKPSVQRVLQLFVGANQGFVQTASSANASSANASSGAASASVPKNFIWFWGVNSSGQLGNGTNGSGIRDSEFAGISYPQYASIANASGAPALGKMTSYIAGGDYHTLGETSSGVVYAWGGNASPELPDKFSILGLGNDPPANSGSQPNPVENVTGSGVMNVNSGTTPVINTKPDQFSFPSIINAKPLTVVTSQEIVISGLSNGAKADLSVQDLDAAGNVTNSGDSEYSLNGAAFTSTPVVAGVGNGDSIVVEHMTSAAYSTQHSTRLTVGGVSANFNSTTEAGPNGSSSSSSKGGCTLNPGQADGSLVILLLTALMLRRRSPVSPSLRS